MRDFSDNLTNIVSKDKIRSIIELYTRAIDRQDEELLLSLYWDDATDHHGDRERSAGDFCRWIMRVLNRFERTQHILGQSIISIAGNRAVAETYVVATHSRRNDEGLLDEVIAARYLDDFQKRDSDWKIARRVVAFDWCRDFTISGSWAAKGFNTDVPMSSPKGSDILYDLLGALRIA